MADFIQANGQPGRAPIMKGRIICSHSRRSLSANPDTRCHAWDHTDGAFRGCLEELRVGGAAASIDTMHQAAYGFGAGMRASVAAQCIGAQLLAAEREDDMLL